LPWCMPKGQRGMAGSHCHWEQHWLPAAGAPARVAPLLRAQPLARSQPGSPQPGCPLPQNQRAPALYRTQVPLCIGTTCLLLLASSLLAFRLGRSLRGAALGVLRKHKHPDYYNTKFIISSDFLIYFVCFKTSLTCGTSFQLFGGRSQTKKLLKAGCTLFLAFDENIFPHVKTVMGSYV